MSSSWSLGRKMRPSLPIFATVLFLSMAMLNRVVALMPYWHCLGSLQSSTLKSLWISMMLAIKVSMTYTVSLGTRGAALDIHAKDFPHPAFP